MTGFVRRECARRGVASAKATVTGLRSLLRFLYLDGQISAPLAGAVPSAACWQLAALPRAVSPAELARLMDSCDRDSAAGRRDFAILVLLARLGLRAGEVAALDLGDICWRQGEITVRGKGSRRDILPLPVDAGEAVAGWLAGGRPREAACPAVFVRLRAPHGQARLDQRVVCRPPCLHQGRGSRGRGAPAAALHSDRHAGGRRDAGRDRAGPAARPARHDRDLRQGRRAGAVAAGTAVAGRITMSQLSCHVGDYLAMRRALGFKLAKEGRLLRDFAAFAEVAGASTVTTDLAVATASGARNVGHNAAIAVGGYVALAGLWASPVSGVSMNPARSLGPALVSGDLHSTWIYLAGPLAGGLLAVALAWALRGPPSPAADQAAQGSADGHGPGAGQEAHRGAGQDLRV